MSNDCRLQGVQVWRPVRPVRIVAQFADVFGRSAGGGARRPFVERVVGCSTRPRDVSSPRLCVPRSPRVASGQGPYGRGVPILVAEAPEIAGKIIRELGEWTRSGGTRTRRFAGTDQRFHGHVGSPLAIRAQRQIATPPQRPARIKMRVMASELVFDRDSLIARDGDLRRGVAGTRPFLKAELGA